MRKKYWQIKELKVFLSLFFTRIITFVILFYLKGGGVLKILIILKSSVKCD